ncbi:putative membrane protein [Actinopolyspora alba]|uniref:Putative membrane protein n=1 Tax=Actinopolyspora alba TaxID=673379 RepID=A0A1I2CCV3_9ACTN|nr:DUF202 domain-containing protein [Actinopolyspora alba]SFE66177.1 putative membrane protein [Actinopolyspora alba]
MSVPSHGTRRWPSRVYGEGDEPDARFSLANERTFLAWLRTAMALMAAGVGIETVNAATSSSRNPLVTWLALLLLAGGVLVSATSFTRWAATERALRTGRPLPAPRMGAVLGYGLAAVGVGIAVLLVIVGI